METPSPDTPTSDTPAAVSAPRPRRRRWLLKLVRSLVVLVALVALFHAIEYWRGWRAFEKVKRELAAKGETLEWAAFIPPPVPDDQNVMKDPFMASRFVKNAKDREWLPKRPVWCPSTKLGWPPSLDQLKALPREPANEAALQAALASSPTNPAMDSVEFDQELLREALALMGDLAKLDLEFSPEALAAVSSGTNQELDTRVSLRWENLTARQALARLLRGNLLGAERPDPAKPLRITLAEPSLEAFLDWFHLYDGEWKALQAAMQRPKVRFDGDYNNPWSIGVFNFLGLRHVSQDLCVWAKVNLLLGNPAAAGQDLEMMWQLTRLTRASPVLVATLIEVALAGLYVSTVGEGLQASLWPDAQLAAIEARLAEFNLLGSFANSFRHERAAWVQFLVASPRGRLVRIFSAESGWFRSWFTSWGLFSALAPRGWVLQNTVLASRYMQVGLDRIDAGKQRYYPAAGRDSPALTALETAWRPYRFLAGVAAPNFEKAATTAASAQTQVNLAIVACALERCRRQTGRYPDSLDALVPRWVQKLPHDLITGEPLKYRRLDSGQYLLYATGLDGKDDGGKGAPTDPNPKDWVWHFVPAK